MMEIKKIIGQLFIIGFQGHTLTKDSLIAEDIIERNLGGVVLFDRFLAENKEQNNIISFSQLRSLTQNLQEFAGNRLFIGVDQEGGRVCRLKKDSGFPTCPSPRQICLKNDASFSVVQANVVASTLAEVGINFNFAPVADLNINQNNPIIGKLQRSYSANPEKVIEQCAIWLDCHHRHGVLGCLKHFPGHGSSKEDSHLGFVDITESWQKRELIPYSELILQNKANAIMVGHLFNANLDAIYPASLSRKIVQGLLRKKLNFKGIIVTDDMQMKAITNRYGLPEAIVHALSAGVDLIIIGNNLEYDPHILKTAIDAVESGIKRGDLSVTVITEAYERIQKMKNEFLCHE